METVAGGFRVLTVSVHILHVYNLCTPFSEYTIKKRNTIITGEPGPIVGRERNVTQAAGRGRFAGRHARTRGDDNCRITRNGYERRDYDRRTSSVPKTPSAEGQTDSVVLRDVLLSDYSTDVVAPGGYKYTVRDRGLGLMVDDEGTGPLDVGVSLRLDNIADKMLAAGVSIHASQWAYSIRVYRGGSRRDGPRIINSLCACNTLNDGINDGDRKTPLPDSTRVPVVTCVRANEMSLRRDGRVLSGTTDQQKR